MKRLINISLILTMFCNVVCSQFISVSSGGITESTNPLSGYFVATDGSDGGAGTMGDPWLTWTFAFEQLAAGDTLIVRGGHYYGVATERRIVDISDVDGTAENPIVVMNYPGEHPIMDGSTITEIDTWLNGIYIRRSEHWKIKGLEIRNLTEFAGGFLATGIEIYGCDNMLIENMTLDSINGWGIAVKDTSHNVTLLNNDVFDVIDIQDDGASADGITVRNCRVQDSIYITNNRIWRCADDGLDLITDSAYTEVVGNWIFDCGIGASGAGNGFKLGGGGLVSTGLTNRLIRNNLAFYNSGYGFTPNGANTPRKIFYNNTSYTNAGQGFQDFTDTVPNTYKNNLCYSDGVCNSVKSTDTASYNSWNTPPGVTVADNDFVSVDSAGITAARVSGSLPVLGFLKLEEGSDLIDAGIDVGLSFNGADPDLGYDESNY